MVLKWEGTHFNVIIEQNCNNNVFEEKRSCFTLSLLLRH